jgi:PadR family transcriptional regulator PadR
MDNWATQLRKGLLELCVVSVLAKGELYAYDLVKQLAEVPGVVVTEGTVYPLLSRLRKAGLVETRLEESPAGPARKYYALSRRGRRIMAMMHTHWGELARNVAAVVDGNGSPHHGDSEVNGNE